MGSWSHQEEKEQHRRSAFHERGLYGCFDRSHLGNIFWAGWSGSDWDERCRCFATTTTTTTMPSLWRGMENLGNHRGVGRIFGLIPLLQMNGKKVHFCPFSSFFVPFWDSLYICPLFLFLFSYLILVGLLERNGRGLILLWGTECLGALLGLLGLSRLIQGRRLFLYLLHVCLAFASIWSVGWWEMTWSESVKFSCWDGFWDYGGPRAWFCTAAVDCNVWLLLTGYWRCLVATTRLQSCETRIHDCSNIWSCHLLWIRLWLNRDLATVTVTDLYMRLGVACVGVVKMKDMWRWRVLLSSLKEATKVCTIIQQ